MHCSLKRQIPARVTWETLASYVLFNELEGEVCVGCGFNPAWVSFPVVPHITDAIQEWVMRQARIPVDEDGIEPQVCVIEVCSS